MKPVICNAFSVAEFGQDLLRPEIYLNPVARSIYSMEAASRYSSLWIMGRISVGSSFFLVFFTTTIRSEEHTF